MRALALIAVVGGAILATIPTASHALGLASRDCETRFRRTVDSQLELADSIAVLLASGAWVRGHFDGASADTAAFRVLVSADISENSTDVHFADIRILKYQERGRIRPGWMAAGLFTGIWIGFVGGALASDHDCSGGEFCVSQAISGAAYGAATGLALGAIVPPMIETTRTLRCGVE